MDAQELRDDDLHDKKMARLARERATLAGLREALAPFAAIGLIRDNDPSGPDMIDAPDLAVTADDVRRARTALKL
jgi:hypothetical protein